MAFAFELGAKVQIIISGEVGTVRGRAEYLPALGEPNYSVNYKAADGRSASDWFAESLLAAAP